MLLILPSMFERKPWNSAFTCSFTPAISSPMVPTKLATAFEMPVLSSNLIIDQRAQPTEKTETFIPKTKVEEEPVKEDYISEINPFRKTKEADGIYLGYEPH